MSRWRTWVVSSLLFPVTLSRIDAQDQQAALLRADRLAAQVSSDSGFAPAMRRALHPTGTLLWPGAPVVGGAGNLTRFLRLLAPRDTLRLTWQPLGVKLAQDSTLGVTWGVAVSSSRVTSGPARIGRYIAAWRRDADRWTLAALVLTGIEVPDSTYRWPGLPLTRPAAKPSGPFAPFLAADLAFARLAQDSGAAVAFRTWAASEAVSFGGGSILVRGPDAIAQAVAGVEHWRWHPVAAGAATSGDLGWTVGEAEIVAPGGKTFHSKYLTVWTRAADGIIRFLLDGGNPRPASP